MQRDIPDIFRIAPEHEGVHLRLENWALWVKPRRPTWMHPMWAKSRSNAFQWHAPEPKPNINPLRAMEMEKAVADLPNKHRHALRWFHVYCYGEIKVRRELGLTSAGLMQLLSDARQMLMNRGM